jgi:hypothetical protein
MKGLRKCGIYIQWNFTQTKKKNEILSFAGKWIELEDIILSEVSLRRPKVACSPSCAHCRPKTNTVILLGTGHTLRGDSTRDE